MRGPLYSLYRMLIFVVAGLALLLSGCQSLSEPAPDNMGDAQKAAQVEQREALLTARTTFQVGGGLGIWTDTETLSARLLWQQLPDKLNLTLSGPMGMGTLNLIDDGTVATLDRGGKPVARGRVADIVLQQGLGLAAPVPVNELGFWIKGLPGNATGVVRDAEGKLSSLRYTDTQGTHWQARFRRYAAWDGIQVPTLVTASGGPYSVRLRLKDWQYTDKTVIPVRPELNNRLPIPGR